VDGDAPATSAPRPHTLAVDVGGSGLKASILDAEGAMVAPRVKIPTPYPLPPERLVAELTTLAAQLPAADRASVGFPGMVRAGRVLTAPNLVTSRGPGSPVDRTVAAAWDRFDLARALEDAFGVPTRLANDADIQTLAVVKGEGLELTITLGTGFGTGMTHHGRLLPHLELAHTTFRKGQTYDEQIGDATRRQISPKRWNRRVEKAIHNMRELMAFDHCYLGGGNARHLTSTKLGADVTIVDNTAGILGGIKLWDAEHIGLDSHID